MTRSLIRLLAWPDLTSNLHRQTRWGPAPTASCSTRSSWSRGRRTPPTTTPAATTPSARRSSTSCWTGSGSWPTSAQVSTDGHDDEEEHDTDMGGSKGATETLSLPNALKLSFSVLSSWDSLALPKPSSKHHLALPKRIRSPPKHTARSTLGHWYWCCLRD